MATDRKMGSLNIKEACCSCGDSLLTFQEVHLFCGGIRNTGEFVVKQKWPCEMAAKFALRQIPSCQKPQTGGVSCIDSKDVTVLCNTL